LVDDTIHPRDITSTIVDLAVRGYIKIEEKVDTFLVFHHKDYFFHLIKPREQWGPDLTPHERVMLENIFLGGTETQLSSLKNRFYTVIPHAFGRSTPPLIDSTELLEKKMDMLNVLTDIEIALSMKSDKKESDNAKEKLAPHPADENYKVEAKFVPNAAKKTIRIVNVIGEVSHELARQLGEAPGQMLILGVCEVARLVERFGSLLESARWPVLIVRREQESVTQ